MRKDGSVAVMSSPFTMQPRQPLGRVVRKPVNVNPGLKVN